MQLQVIVRVIIHEKLTILFHYKICLNLQAAEQQSSYNGDSSFVLSPHGAVSRGRTAWWCCLELPYIGLGRSQRFSEQADGPKSHPSILHPGSNQPTQQSNNLTIYIYTLYQYTRPLFMLDWVKNISSPKIFPSQPIACPAWKIVSCLWLMSSCPASVGCQLS